MSIELADAFSVNASSGARCPRVALAAERAETGNVSGKKCDRALHLGRSSNSIAVCLGTAKEMPRHRKGNGCNGHGCSSGPAASWAEHGQADDPAEHAAAALLLAFFLALLLAFFFAPGISRLKEEAGGVRRAGAEFAADAIQLGMGSGATTAGAAEVPPPPRPPPLTPPPPGSARGRRSLGRTRSSRPCLSRC